MSFLSNVLSEFAGGGQHRRRDDDNNNNGGYGYGYGGGGAGGYAGGGGYGAGYGAGGPPPRVPPPWVARWDERAGRWLFVNEATGARTFEHPAGEAGYHRGPPPGAGPAAYGEAYGREGYAGGYGREGYAREGYGGYGEGERRRDGGGRHGIGALGAGALGGVAGLAGGALLMHEGERIGRFFLAFCGGGGPCWITFGAGKRGGEEAVGCEDGG